MPRQTTERFYWNVPDDILAITHGGRLPMALIPEGIRSLEGTPIDSQVGVMVTLRDAEGTLIGIGSELEVYPDDGGPLQVCFTFLIRGRGTIVAYEVKGYDDPTLETIGARVAETGTPWTGDLAVVSTSGPAPNGKGLIIAGTGEFEGVSGYMAQTMGFRRIAADGPPTVHNCETLELTWPS